MKRLFSYLTILTISGCSGDTTLSNTTTTADGASATTSSEDATTEAEEVPVFSRIVTVPGNITETVFALGSGDSIVGACESSRYPEEVEDIPKVGYRTNLNAEGVLSLSPEIVIATEEVGPEEVIEQIRAAGIRVEIVAGERDLDGAVQRITDIASLLGRESRGQELVQAIHDDLEGVEAPADPPSVLFIYVARNMSMVAGSGTAAESMIELAGGRNAVTEFEDFQPMNPEAIIAANPDFILLDESGMESIGGIDGVLDLPGISETTAGREGHVIAMDKTLLLGFGPRMSEGVVQLAELIRN